MFPNTEISLYYFKRFLIFPGTFRLRKYVCENLVIRNNIINRMDTEKADEEIVTFSLMQCKNTVFETNFLGEKVVYNAK